MKEKFKIKGKISLLKGRFKSLSGFSAAHYSDITISACSSILQIQGRTDVSKIGGVHFPSCLYKRPTTAVQGVEGGERGRGVTSPAD